MGFTTVLTLSGVTQKSDLDKYAYSPDFIINSVGDLLQEELFNRVLERQQEMDAAVGAKNMVFS